MKTFVEIAKIWFGIIVIVFFFLTLGVFATRYIVWLNNVLGI